MWHFTQYLRTRKKCITRGQKVFVTLSYQSHAFWITSDEHKLVSNPIEYKVDMRNSLAKCAWHILNIDDPSCSCGAKPETIEHVVLVCPLLREFEWKSNDISIMVSDPEAIRILLRDCFPGLQIQGKNEVNKGGTNNTQN